MSVHVLIRAACCSLAHHCKGCPVLEDAIIERIGVFALLLVLERLYVWWLWHGPQTAFTICKQRWEACDCSESVDGVVNLAHSLNFCICSARSIRFWRLRGCEFRMAVRLYTCHFLQQNLVLLRIKQVAFFQVQGHPNHNTLIWDDNTGWGSATFPPQPQ